MALVRITLQSETEQTVNPTVDNYSWYRALTKAIINTVKMTALVFMAVSAEFKLIR
jgi:hypothetical protein